MRNTLGLIVVACLCCGTAARADTIRITSGAVQVTGPLLSQPWLLSDDDELLLEAPGVSTPGSLVDVSAFLQLTFPPTIVATGALFDASGVLHVGSNRAATFNNVSGLIPAPFTLTFDASPARVVCRSSNDITECSGSAPFSFHSDLTFLPFEGPPVVHHLVGGGTAEVGLSSFNDFQLGSVRYNFEASPTPEPATLSLFVMGAMTAGGRAWHRRRAGRNC
jgi:hypothetical protein